MSSHVLSQGRRGGAPGWYGRRAWLADVDAVLTSPDGQARLRRRHVSADAVRRVADRDGRVATSTSGGDVATAHATVARALRLSRSTVERARRFLRESGLTQVVETGRYLTSAERRAAGNGQIRAASTRVLTHPGVTAENPRYARRDVLPRKRFVPALTHDVKRSPRRAVEKFSRPMWAQILAGKLAARLVARGERWIEHRHIGNLVRGLADQVAIPSSTTVDELVAALAHARPAPSDGIRDPLAWLLHQIDTVSDRLWAPRLRPTAPIEHEHDFRAVHSPTELGCLTCPAVRTITREAA